MGELLLIVAVEVADEQFQLSFNLIAVKQGLPIGRPGRSDGSNLIFVACELADVTAIGGHSKETVATASMLGEGDRVSVGGDCRIAAWSDYAEQGTIGLNASDYGLAVVWRRIAKIDPLAHPSGKVADASVVDFGEAAHVLTIRIH